MPGSRYEIAFLLDANISTDMLVQIESLIKGMADDSVFGVRLIVFGSVDSDSAVSRRYDRLCSVLKSEGAGSEPIHFPLRDSIHPFDTLNLVRQGVLADCDLWHCFSLSLLDNLLGLPQSKLVRPGFLTLSSWPGDRVVQRLARRNSSFAGVICVTADLREALVANGFPAEKCAVIEPVLADERKTPNKAAARKILNIEANADLILTEGQMSACSNHLQVSWAAAVTGQFRPNVRVIFPGCDRHLEKVRHRDATLTPSSLGIFPKERHDPEVLYSAADVLVLAGTEPFSPLPLIRAGRAGLAVVASDNRYYRRYLRHEENAILFGPNAYSPGNRANRRIPPLAGAIARLFDDRALADQLAKRLSQDTDSSFLPKGGSLTAHLALYQNILNTSHPTDIQSY